MMEQALHEESCFITLTYKPESYPADGSVSKREMQLFLKRLRKLLEPLRFRYFACGEYGKQTKRAHYHAILFGVGVSAETHILEAWGQGFVMVADLTPQRAAYTCGYVTKKLEPKLLPDGVEPEFALMSRGLGRGLVPQLVEALNRPGARSSVLLHGDAPGVLRFDGRVMPVGRYLHSLIRKGCGSEDGKAAKWLVEERQKDLRGLFACYGAAKAIGRISRSAQETVNERALRQKLKAEKGEL